MLIFLSASCEKEEEIIVCSIDIEQFLQNHLKDFHLLRSNQLDEFNNEYVFVSNTDTSNIFIRIGIYASANDSKNAISDYLNDISIGMTTNSERSDPIGDECWWYESNSIVTNLLFRRFNAVLILSSHTYSDLRLIARNLDDDIINKEEYIRFK